MTGGYVLLGIWAAAVVWRYFSKSGRAWGAQMDATKADRAPKRLSQVAARPEGIGSLTCPICGGSQFTAHRSGRGKVAAGLLARKSRVRCVTCGTDYLRG